MNILLVLIPVTLLIVLIAVGLFFWAVNHQQFDDLDSPAVLPLLDEPPPAGPAAAKPAAPPDAGTAAVDGSSAVE
ncbi:MAG: cbb3-type cytochrome oxidase assembly protein CcoS [Xanthomonadaceae bacterium]|nr:cbb3-type cytochrome oxidase assembly protein CcoS [Xanthomonadaceae bacterium]